MIYPPPECTPSAREQFNLDDRVCVITGGGGFLGVQFAEALADAGGLPILLDVADDGLAVARARVEEGFGPCESEVVDVTDEDSIRRATDRVMQRHGRIDVLVNAAGLTKYGCDADPDAFYATFEQTAQEVWDAGIKINLTGVMLCCKVIGAEMLKAGIGSIVNIGSDIGVISPDQRIYQPDGMGYEGVPFNAPAFYSTSKAGVIHLTKHLAALWGPLGVRVNAFSPAGVFRGHEEGFYRQLASRIPMGRMAAEHEYKGAIVFLASDASRFMTGHNLVMDGGRTIW